MDDSHPARWWTRLESGRVRCDLCPRHCELKPGQRGFCFVRQATDEGMALTTWGRSSGFCIDPIEKKPLHHFLPGSSVLSFGTAGCNLGCRFCQNWDLSKARRADRLQDRATPSEIAASAAHHGCASVAYTYNDPVIFAEYALDIAAACREAGVGNVAVTAGWIESPAREEFFAAMDAANVDLKSFSEDFYRRQCGASLGPVLETLEHVATATDCWLEITTLLVPGLNDSEEELDRLTAWVAERCGTHVPMHFSAFHPAYKVTDRPRTPTQTLLRAREIAQGNGLHYTYTGNVHDWRSGSTWCPSCGELLIRRDWYDLGAYALEGSACARCGHEIPGVFDPSGRGDWGRRRQRVRVT